MKVKYALLTLSRNVDITAVFPFSPNAYLLPEGIGRQIEGNERVAHWKEWLGSLEWQKIERSEALIVWMPTQRPVGDIAVEKVRFCQKAAKRTHARELFQDGLRRLAAVFEPGLVTGSHDAAEGLRRQLDKYQDRS